MNSSKSGSKIQGLRKSIPAKPAFYAIEFGVVCSHFLRSRSVRYVHPRIVPDRTVRYTRQVPSIRKGRSMDIIFTVSLVGGIAAAGVIGLTMLAIALGIIKV